MSTNHNPEWAHSPNISILKRVTSRVSQWFSPSGASPNNLDGDQQQLSGSPSYERDATSREFNGNQRRRGADMISPASTEAERAQEMQVQPPLKRSKTTIEERHSVLRHSKTTLTSSTPTTTLLNNRRRLRSGFAMGGTAATPFDFSSLRSSRSGFETSSFNADLVRNYRRTADTGAFALGPKERTSQVVLGYDQEVDEEEVDEEEEEEEDVNPDDEVQIVFKPEKASLQLNNNNNNNNNNDDDEEDSEGREDQEEKNDTLTELNVRRNQSQQQQNQRLRGGKQVNGSDKEGGAESGSESATSQDSSTHLISKRRKLGLNRMVPTAKNGSSSIGSSINFTSHLQSNKSLFSDKNILASAGPSSLNASTTSLNSLAPKRSFNAGLYGSMSALSDSRLLNIKSPYYNGPTMFGGASAYSQKPLHKSSANKLFRSNTGLPMMRPSSSLSSLSMLGRSPVAPTSGTGGDGGAGGSPKGTARRVLDLINQLNSPLEEIRKMASGSLLNESKRLPSLVGQRSRFAADVKSGIRLNAPKTPYSRQTAPAADKRSPLTTELQVPSMPQLLQMNKLQRSTEEIRRLAFQSRSTLNQETEYKLPGENATETVTKMKNKLNRMATRGGGIDGTAGGGGGLLTDGEKEGEDVMEVPQLPEIKFPEMKAMPRIDIKLPEPVTGAVKGSEAQEGKTVFSSNNFQSKSMGNGKNSVFTTSPPVIGNVSPRSDFRFAAPITLNSTTDALSPVKMNFVFSEPSGTEERVNKSSSAPGTAAAAPLFGQFKFNPGTAKVKEGFSSQEVINAEQEKKTELGLKKGSVEEALGLAPQKKVESSLAPLQSSSFGDKFKPAANTWSCSICMVRNKETDLKCLACSTPKELPATIKPSIAAEKKKETNGDEGFKALVAAQKADKWECSECMLKNEHSKSKCACCDSPRPGSKSTEPPTLKSGNPFATQAGSSFAFGFQGTNKPGEEKKSTTEDSGFGKLMSAQQAKWECSTCMTRNEQSKSKCACCEQAKPGAPPEKSAQFSFGAVSNSNKFSFGIKQAAEKVDAKETLPAPSFSFGVPTTTSKSVETATALNPAALSFSFGIPKAPESVKAVEDSKKVEEVKEIKSLPAAVPVVGGFKFGVPSQIEKKTDDEVKKKEGGFKFGMAAPVAPVTGQTKATSAAPASGGFTFGVPPVAASTISTTTSSSSTTIEVKAQEIAKTTEEVKNKNAATTTMTFGSPSSFLGAKPVVPAFGSAATATGSATPGAPKKIEVVNSPVFGSSSFFGSKETNVPAVKEIIPGFGASSATTTTPFAFGGPSTAGSTSDKLPVFGAKNPNSMSSIKPIAFGVPSATATTTTAGTPASETPKATFAFGAPAAAKKEEPNVFGSQSPTPFGFGSSSNNNAQSGSVGGAASTNNNPSSLFGGTKLGASAPTSSASNSLFGGIPSSSPAFGAAAPVSTFGAAMSASPFGAQKPAEQTTTTAASLFGSNASNSTTNSGPFGSAAGASTTGGMFGGIAAPQNKIPAFGSSAPVPGNSFDVKDGPSPFQFGQAQGSAATSNNNRAFGFGGSGGQQQQVQDNNKAFNFSASVQPNFNFGGAQNAPEPQQNQPYTFGGGAPLGAAGPAPGQGAFNFMGSSSAETGSISSPSFQFSATTNNPFYPGSQPSNNSAAQQGRRILKARRTKPN